MFKQLLLPEKLKPAQSNKAWMWKNKAFVTNENSPGPSLGAITYALHGHLRH